MTARARRAAAAALVAALCAHGAGAAGTGTQALELRIDRVQGPGWSAGPVHLHLRAADDGTLALSVDVERVALPAPLAGVRAAALSCAAARADGAWLRCERARLTLSADGGVRTALEAAVSVDTAGGTLRVDAPLQPLAGGRSGATLRFAPAQSELDLRLEDVDLAALGAAFGSPALPLPVSAGRASGRIALLRRPASGRLDASVEVADLAFSDASGLNAGEGVAGTLRAQARARDGAWDFDLGVRVGAGAVYVAPVLLDAASGALQAQAQGRWLPGAALHLSRLSLSDPGVAEVSARAEVALSGPPRLRALTATLAQTDAGPLYRRYLRPFAGAGVLADLALAGRVSGAVDWRRDGPASARMALSGVDVGDPGGRFAVLGLDAELHWAAGPGAPRSRIGWREAQAGSFALGGGEMGLELAQRDARLLAPLELALLDARLRVARLEARALGLDGQRIEADVEITPISLERLSERLAWLPLSGTVAATIPDLVYAGRRLEVRGDVVLELFGGSGTVTGLSLEDPFGVVPRLRADLAVRGIDLEVLTRALSFGSIEGRLDGRVDGLVLEGWQPVAFDASLNTPPGDTSRHRISQRAVDNLASLGGAGSVLSSTFLRFFQEFSYERLGLSCRLAAGVCRMGGVAPAERGYYIVRGGGLPPRVDVIGFNDRVDWATLLERLRAVASARGPVVR